MNISFVIVNYMQETYLDNMLLSISNVFSIKFNITIVIVDNSNSINAVAFFETHRELSKQIKIKIFKNENTGYLKASRVLLAPQVITPAGKNQNPNRVKSFSKFEVFVNDISTINYGTYKLITNIRKILKKIYVRVRTISKQTGKQEIWLPHGSCIIVDFNTLKDSNFFNENIFLWGEEVIIAEKARRHGATVLFEPSLKVFHNEHSATSNIIAKSKFEIWKESYATYRPYL